MEEVKEVEVVKEIESNAELNWDTNLFNKLYNYDVAMYKEELEQRNKKFDYLSWSNAYQLLIHQDPKAELEICENKDGFPVFEFQGNFMVKTKVTAFGITKSCWLPVMDGNHNAVKNVPYEIVYSKSTVKVPSITARHINDSIMRCFVKNVAMFGIGLKLYTGEDLRQYKEVQSVNEQLVTKEQLNEVDALTREKNIPMIEIKDYCKKQFKSPLDKIYTTQATAVIEMLKKAKYREKAQ